MDEGGEEQEGDTDGHTGVSNIERRKEREIDEVHDSAIEKTLTAEQSIEEVADRSTEYQAKGDSLELA